MTLDSIHADVATRSALTPLSCSRRGLSTTARIRRPRAVDRKSTPSPTTTRTVAAITASWFESIPYECHR